MPLANRSAAPLPYFAEAVVEDILTDLSRMRETLVIASGTTRALAARGQTDPVQVGRELGVQLVLTGTLQREGERLQLQVHLSRTANGALLWSERFDDANAAVGLWRRDVASRIAALPPRWT
jgi:TolB-like protein